MRIIHIAVSVCCLLLSRGACSLFLPGLRHCPFSHPQEGMKRPPFIMLKINLELLLSICDLMGILGRCTPLTEDWMSLDNMRWWDGLTGDKQSMLNGVLSRKINSQKKSSHHIEHFHLQRHFIEANKGLGEGEEDPDLESLWHICSYFFPEDLGAASKSWPHCLVLVNVLAEWV